MIRRLKYQSILENQDGLVLGLPGDIKFGDEYQSFACEASALLN